MGMCESCKKESATFHLTNLTRDGEKIEKHLCERCAIEQGLIQVQQPPAYAQDVLDKFMKTAKGDVGSMSNVVCEECGTSYLEFRNQGLLGCPNDYDVFRDLLNPLLERAHGATHHTGKTPCSLGSGRTSEQQIQQFKRLLADAVAAEDYERAAELRDRIDKLEL